MFEFYPAGRGFESCWGRVVLSRDIVPVMSQDFFYFYCPGWG